MEKSKTTGAATMARVPPPPTGSDLPFGTVIYEQRLRNPRSMILEGRTVVTEGLGVGCIDSPMTRDEWLEWLELFRDELTGAEFRECREAVEREFREPKEWQDFRDRYEATGSPWLD